MVAVFLYYVSIAAPIPGYPETHNIAAAKQGMNLHILDKTRVLSGGIYIIYHIRKQSKYVQKSLTCDRRPHLTYGTCEFH